jgi:hypothetical protein
MKGPKNLHANQPVFYELVAPVLARLDAYTAISLSLWVLCCMSA